MQEAADSGSTRYAGEAASSSLPVASTQALDLTRERQKLLPGQGAEVCAGAATLGFLLHTVSDSARPRHCPEAREFSGGRRPPSSLPWGPPLLVATTGHIVLPSSDLPQGAVVILQDLVQIESFGVSEWCKSPIIEDQQLGPGRGINHGTRNGSPHRKVECSRITGPNLGVSSVIIATISSRVSRGPIVSFEADPLRWTV